MCPHSAQRRRCSHQPPVARHSTHPSPLASDAGLIPRQCVGCFFIGCTAPIAYDLGSICPWTVLAQPSPALPLRDVEDITPSPGLPPSAMDSASSARDSD